MKTRFPSYFVVASAIASTSIPLALGAPLYWDLSNASGLTAGNGTWGTSSFWATGSSPGTTAPGAWVTGSDAFFQTGGTNTVAIAVGGVSALSLTQTTNSTVTTISSGGGSLTITGAAGVVNSGNAALTINTGLILGSGATTTYTFNAGNTITIGGGISQSGTASINKTGAGLLNLNASNSYAGGTSVAAGRLIVGASGNLGTNVNTNNISVSAGGNLGIMAAANVGANQTISISSSSTALGGFGVGYTGMFPTLNTAGTSTFGGVFGINYTGTAGITSLASLANNLNAGVASGQWFLGSQGTGIFNGATLAPGSDAIYRLGGGGGSLTFSQANVITGANAVTIGANLTGASGTVVFGAAQNYTGATTVNGGTLKLGHVSALGNSTNYTSGLTLNGSSVLDLNGFSPTASFTLTLNSTANGNNVGSITNTNGGTFTTTTNPTPATFSGPVIFNAGTITVGGGDNTGGSGNISLTGSITGNGKNLTKNGLGVLSLENSGTVTLGNLTAVRGSIQVDSGTTLNVATMDIGTGNGVGGGLILDGGNVTSAGLSRFGQGGAGASGSITLNGGTLTVPALTKGSVTFNANFNGGTLKANAASTTFFTGANNALVKAGGAFIDDGGFAITIGQALNHDTALAATPDGGLTKSGSGKLTLSGANGYTGDTSIKAGTLALADTGTFASSPAIIVGTAGSSGTVLDLTAKSAFSIGNAQTLKGIGNVNIGAGKNFTIEGTHAAGNGVGKQTITGNLSYSGGSIFAWELDSNVDSSTGTRGTDYDAVDITGNLAMDETASAGSTFKVILGTVFNGTDAFWTANRSWDVFNVTGSNSDSFTNFQLFNASAPGTEITSGAYSPYGSFGYSFSSGTGTLTWTAVPEPSSMLAGLLIAAGFFRRRRA